LDIHQQTTRWVLYELTKYNPDILGLQEFRDNWFEGWLTKELEILGYAFYMDELQSYGSPKAIFYKANRFICEDASTFQIVLTERSSGTWVILNDLKTSNRYFVCNNHWATTSSADRQESTDKVINVIEQNSEGLPLILIGDLNAVPGTSEISILKNYGLVSTHSEKGDTYNGWNGSGIRKIDWIFCSPDLNIIKLRACFIVNNSS
jgi:endonuclease/exonuclease/phosphatase family metal-dependent hydrolase